MCIGCVDRVCYKGYDKGVTSDGMRAHLGIWVHGEE